MGNADQIPDPGMEFDAQSLRDKYRQERDKRLRPDGNRQYIETTGQFARYFEVDPYVEPGFTREPLNEEIEVAIIGGGFCGLLAVRGCAKQASPASALSKPVATSAAPGTGTATPAANATSNPISTSRSSRS
jgi:hypothetical protein